MYTQFEKGELVRCEDEYGHWIGKVIAIDAHTLTVKWFADGERYAVPKQDAVSFAQFLTQQKRSHKLKTVYSEFFGGKPLKRMPRQRLDELQQVLREHGVVFDESVTRANDYFSMWVNVAHLTQSERDVGLQPVVLPDHVTAWLPKWIVSEPLPPSSRDPLGLQADAGQLANALLPGLTVFTNRIGYFFFLSWAVRKLNRINGPTAKERRDMLNRLERALVLCETLYHGKNDFKNCFHQGQRAKQRLLAEANITAAIPDRILKNQNGTGCCNLYRTAMRSCGFWEDHDKANLAGQLPFRLTARGEKLANAFARRKGTQDLLKWAKDGTSQRQVQTLQQWAESFCFHTFYKKTNKKWVLEGFLFAKDDRADVVNDADTRLRTLRTLAGAGLLSGFTPTGPATTLVSNETAGADVTELAELPDWGENIAFLLHFYRDRTQTNAEPFVAAAVYELLGLALNAVWSGLIDHVLEHGRTSLANWSDTLIRESSNSQFWEAPFRTAASTFQTSEEQLIDQLFAGEYKVEEGLNLAARVLSQKNNRMVLDEQLANTTLQTIVSLTFLSNVDEPTRAVLVNLVTHLVDHHRMVSERKGKERWLDTDGNEVWEMEARPMDLGFHSYRFPQLMSLVRDLQLTEYDLNEP